jgi:hypothetical protein
MDMIITATNHINDLECDLMPFLQKIGYPNFKIDHSFPWIKDATTKLKELFTDNIGEPEELLERYQKYDYVINVDKKTLIDDLFHRGENKNEKAPLEEIREKIAFFDTTHYEIMTLSEDEVNYKLFRISAKKMKNELGERALKWKNLILETTYNYCNDTTNELKKLYFDMQSKISHDPINERELIDTKDFINKSAAEVDKVVI